MTREANPNRVLWISDVQPPLCHVPWTGTVVVLADGAVNFCCYSDAVVGNVNEQTFEEIWNGQTMTSIRRQLAAQVFPRECRSMSCPFYRGDKLTYLAKEIEPHNFHATGTHDPHSEIRKGLEGSILHALDERTLALDLIYSGPSRWTDLFAAIRCADGVIRFVPSMEDFPLPFRSGLDLAEQQSPLRIEMRLPDAFADAREACVALFEGDTDPNRLSNCYWSETLSLADLARVRVPSRPNESGTYSPV